MSGRRDCAATADTIPPGVTRSGEFIVQACYRPNCAPRFEVTPIPGTDRMLLGLRASAVTNATGSIALSAPPVHRFAALESVPPRSSLTPPSP